jgi:AcrR family transcriptional regulator
MTQEERKIAAINNILDSAEEYIQKNGVNDIDINKICKSAGLTKGAFYHHFRNKQHLLLELFNRWIIQVSTEIKLTEYSNIDPVDLIIHVIDSISPAFVRSTNQLPIFLELYVRAINDKRLKKYVVKSYNSFISFFSEVLKNGMDKGFVKNDNPVRLSKILFSLTLGLLIQGLINPESENWQKMAKKSVSLILSK